jgi:AraC family transcriptional regulator of adaptative response/methylated-DNA-[protein]-cysteine methyltransferase
MTTIINSVFSTQQARWDALTQRDPQADGVFWYGVRTTKIYCRPTCSSRMPNRANVCFFDTPDDAEEAGFRPCKRCRPRLPATNGIYTDAIANACKHIETAEVEPSLNELASAAGLSPYHFHRMFKAAVGVTPKQYAVAQRVNRVQNHLQQDATVTEAIYNAGFGSSSRFYENGADTLGMKPAAYQKGGRGMRIRFALAQTYLGWALVAATEQGICAIDFGASRAALEAQLHARFPEAECRSDDPEFAAWVAQVVAFVEAPKRGLDLPLDIQGTAFQRRVWAALREIPPGSTASYAEIAARIGNPKAVRAVAQACASNTLAVAVPCHRVVRSDGDLSGYRWGVERKRALLEREAQPVSEE